LDQTYAGRMVDEGCWQGGIGYGGDGLGDLHEGSDAKEVRGKYPILRGRGWERVPGPGGDGERTRVEEKIVRGVREGVSVSKEESQSMT